MHNLSCENEFYLDENEESFAYQNLVLIQRPRGTRKWPCKIAITFNLKYIITHCIEWTARAIVVFLTF